jgi:hypothetical protein
MAKYGSENVGELKFWPWLSKKSVPDYGKSDMFEFQRGKIIRAVQDNLTNLRII